jgi:tetratricopeptide (TPR) repeat protein
LPPYSQDDEGMFGKDGPFHPASLETTTRGRIPSTFCMTSQRCADCHADIFRQWSESAHRFSSFNNQWYRKSVDGWVNIARSRLQEGQVEGAQEVLRKALELDPDLPKAHFFYALALKADGEYEAALTHLRRAAAHYPEDRVVRNQMGRILFLYNLMLSYRGVGNLDLGQGHEGLYRRFKADESAQVIAAVGRRRHPEADNEAQPVHQHHSIPLPLTTTADRPKTGG